MFPSRIAVAALVRFFFGWVFLLPVINTLWTFRVTVYTDQQITEGINLRHGDIDGLLINTVVLFMEIISVLYLSLTN
jgi:hypothetical protein